MENEALNFSTQEKEWKENSNDKLKDRGSPYRVYNTKTILIVFIIVSISFVGVFYYLGTNNYFKSQINNSCQACQTCSACSPCNCFVNLTCGSSNATAISNMTIYINNNTNQS